jgi:hypothetical protein
MPLIGGSSIAGTGLAGSIANAMRAVFPNFTLTDPNSPVSIDSISEGIATYINTGGSGGGIVIEGTAETDDSVLAGQVLTLKNTGHVGLAKADNMATANVCGLAEINISATLPCTFVIDGNVVLADWTNVVGTPNLVVGATYYVSNITAGHLTTIAPTIVGQYVIIVGQAITNLVLAVEISQRILL